MTYAVHNIHVRAVKIAEDGTYTLNGTYRIPCGAALFTADTYEDAERVRWGD
jgi:hypothetical protein